MKTRYTVALAMLAGVAIGAIAVQGLHAQGARLKAYSVGEVELLGGSEDPAYLTAVRKAITEHHGRTLRTIGGRVVKIEGAEPPQHLALVEWDSVKDAQDFYSSKAWVDFAPQRDKIQKTIRRYIVETEK